MDHTTTGVTGSQVKRMRRECSNSPEVLADWALQKSFLEQELSVLRWAEARRLEGLPELGKTRKPGHGQTEAVKRQNIKTPRGS